MPLQPSVQAVRLSQPEEIAKARCVLGMSLTGTAVSHSRGPKSDGLTDQGLGACSWTVDTNVDMQIALPFAFMGEASNDNPYCGRHLTLHNPFQHISASATVGDKCMGCQGRSIDLTNILFNAIVPGGDGRVSGIEWWFT